MSKNGSTLHVISDGHVMYHVTLDQSNKGETQKVQVDAYCLRQVSHIGLTFDPMQTHCKMYVTV